MIKRDFTNKIGINPCVYLSRWGEEEGFPAIRKASEQGYDLICVPLRNLAAVDPDKTARVFAECGTSPVNTFVFALEDDIASNDKTVSERGVSRLLEAIAKARDMGSTFLGGPIHQALTKHAGPVDPQGVENAMRGLDICATEAAKSGIKLSIEVLNRYESSMINTGTQAMAFLDKIGNSNLWVHLDTYAMNIEECDMAAAIAYCMPRLAYLEIGESHRGRLGTGSVDIAGAVRAAVRAGYSGPLGYEAFSAGTSNPQLNANLATWRTMWTDNDAAAQEALDRIVVELNAANASLYKLS